MEKRAVDLSLLDGVLQEYAPVKGSLITILQHTQEIYGYLPREAIELISEKTGIATSEIMGVGTFYTQFRFEPVGKYLIMLCQGTACHVNSSELILQTIKDELQVPIVTDVHTEEQVKPVAQVADIIQIPAFLCRQTDLLYAAAKSGAVVNVKKGQFMAPGDMRNVVDKLHEGGCSQIMLTERGATFGYNNLVVDMRTFPIMRSFGYPVVFDGTHSVQLPGGAGTCSAGNREYVPHLVRAAVGAGVDALFMEVHDNPEEALCDGPNMVYLDKLEDLLKSAIAIHDIVRKEL